MNGFRSFHAIALATALVALPACQADPGPVPLAGARMRDTFDLVDQTGRHVTGDSFAGKYRIVYFGYTFCPDVCPVDLQLISAALRQFERDDPARAGRVQPIFITTDPERDTPRVLADYIDNFHPRLIALTGSADAIGRAAQAHGVTYSRREGTANGTYLLDHSRYAVLYGPAGEPIEILAHDQGPGAIVATLDRWVR